MTLLFFGTTSVLHLPLQRPQAETTVTKRLHFSVLDQEEQATHDQVCWCKREMERDGERERETERDREKRCNELFLCLFALIVSLPSPPPPSSACCCDVVRREHRACLVTFWACAPVINSCFCFCFPILGSPLPQPSIQRRPWLM